MIEFIRSLIEVCFAWLLVTQLASLLGAVAYPGFRRLISGCQPAEKALAQLGYGLLAVFVGTWVVIMIMNPSLSALLQPEHCHQGDCSAHTPLISHQSVIGATLASSAFLILLVFASLVLARTRRQHQRLLTLESLSNTHSKPHYRVLPVPHPVAWCSGLWRPTVFLSRGLLQQLNTPQLQVVLAHEICHANRSDNLRKWVLHLATMLWPRVHRSVVRRDFMLSCEEICDEAAVQQCGSREQVMEVIQLMAGERKTADQQPLPVSAGSHFTDDCSAHRIRLLTQSPQYHSGLAGWTFLLGFLIFQIVLFTVTSHHLLEWLSL